MDKRNKISFIPQKPISRKVQRPSRPISLMIAVSFTIFFLTFAVYGGMFFYNNNLEKLIDDKQEDLKSAKEKLDPDNTIEEAQKFQKKIDDIKSILGSHVSASAVFGLLEDITLKSVFFNTFEFSMDKEVSIQDSEKDAGGTSRRFIVSLDGVAPNYSSVAYQSDVIKKEIKENNRIESFSISNVSLNDTGSVLFNLEMSIVPSFLSYKNAIKQNQVSQVSAEDTEQSDNNNDESVAESDNLDLSELDNILNEFN